MTINTNAKPQTPTVPTPQEVRRERERIKRMSEDYRTLAEYEIMQKRRIVNSWNPDEERILKIWAEKASGWAWLHEKSSRYYHKITNKMMYPSIILSTVAGGLGLSIFGVGDNFKHASKLLVVVIGVMNLSSALLASLQKFVRSTEKTELHNQMNKLFSSYYRRIVMELALKPSDRRNCLEFCLLCRDEYDKLVTDSPEVPNEVIKLFKSTFPNAKHVPEVANGLVHFNDYQITKEGLEWDRTHSTKSEIIKYMSTREQLYPTLITNHVYDEEYVVAEHDEEV